MATQSASLVMGQFLRMLRTHDAEGRTDGQLLERFLVNQDEAAFAVLVRRHGPMVFGVCRRILGNDVDSEDAFQATFLVLVRKAPSLKSRSILGDWLHGVARHTALKTKAASTHRRAKEKAVARPDATTEEPRNDWLPILDEELARLPEKYRLPIILCDLEGKTRREAAEQLGWPEGTVAGRLARARTMLAKALARHGVAFSGGALAVAISQITASACVPGSLLFSTVKAASMSAAGKALAGVVSTKVAALAEGVMKAMLLTKLKTVITVLPVLGMVAFGGGLLSRHTPVGQQIQAAERAVVLAVPAPKAWSKPTGILILDDCDHQYQGKEEYKDNLTLLDPAGNQSFRLSGFNNCESIGSSRMVAADRARKCIWVIENVAHRIRRFDLAGKETLTIPGVDGSAIAVDAETGNVWALLNEGGIGTGKTVVFDASGKEVASYNISGWDIVYDRKSKAFWIAETKLTKITAATGEVISSVDVATWCASSVDVDRRSGSVWVTVREHPEAAGSRNRLLNFDADGKEVVAIDLAQRRPFRVSVDPKDGSVWVAHWNKSVQRFSADGKPQAEHAVEALAVQVDPTGGDAWVVTPMEVQRMTPKGDVTKRVRHASKTSQAWIASLE